MKLFIFFGLPGAGKTYTAKVAEKYFGYHLYDGDIDLTDEMLRAIQKKSEISDAMRDVFFTNLIESTKNLSKKYDKLIIHQTFIKDKYRKQLILEIPEAKFILVESDFAIREHRLKNRREFPLDPDYARKMADIFDLPQIKHGKIHNNSDGEDSIKTQLEKILV